MLSAPLCSLQAERSGSCVGGHPTGSGSRRPWGGGAGGQREGRESLRRPPGPGRICPVVSGGENHGRSWFCGLPERV